MKNVLRDRPVIAVLALLTAVLALASIPMAMAKYKTVGTASASVRIARFNPVITLNEKWPGGDPTKYVLINSRIYMNEYDGMKFTVLNNGETTINVAPRLVNTAGTAYPQVEFSSGTGSMNIPAGQSIVVTMKIKDDTTFAAYTDYRAELRVDVVQVD